MLKQGRQLPPPCFLEIIKKIVYCYLLLLLLTAIVLNTFGKIHL